MQQWKRFIGDGVFDYDRGKEEYYPGPVDNSKLFKGRVISSCTCILALPINHFQSKENSGKTLRRVSTSITFLNHCGRSLSPSMGFLKALIQLRGMYENWIMWALVQVVFFGWPLIHSCPADPTEVWYMWGTACTDLCRQVGQVHLMWRCTPLLCVCASSQTRVRLRPVSVVEMTQSVSLQYAKRAHTVIQMCRNTVMLPVTYTVHGPMYTV